MPSRRRLFFWALAIEPAARRAAFLLAPLAAMALALPATGAPIPRSAVTLTNEQTALAAITDDVQVAATPFADAPGGHVGLLTLELEDDFDAVQIGVENQYTTAWGVSRVVVAPSANYGGDPAMGAAAYDLDGTMLPTMLPVQWPQQGASDAPPGAPVLSLPTLHAAPAGQPVLRFDSMTTGPAFGATQPGVGWFVSDGLGCIAPGTTIAAIAVNTVTLSAPVSGQGCAGGQAIYFAPGAFGSFGAVVPPAKSSGAVALALSNWVPLRSLPRTDGAFTLGARVAGTGIPTGTTLAAIGYASLTLSQPVTAALPAQTAVHVHLDAPLAAAAAAGSTMLTLTQATGVRAGQTVTTSGAEIGTRTHVAAVAGNVVTLDRPILADIPAGAMASFIGTTWLSAPAKVGDTILLVPSTTGRPLLHIRYFTQPRGLLSAHHPECVRDPITNGPGCEAPLGLPPVWVGAGGETTALLPIDGVNFVSAVGAGAGSPSGRTAYPSFFVRFLGRHAGATLLICGGYQSSGAAGSVSGEASLGRIGAAQASLLNPAVPISVLNMASHQNDTGVNEANCAAMIDTLHPGMALIQEYSNHNFTSPTTYRVGVRALAEHALLAGTQPIIYLAYVEAGAYPGGLPVTSDVLDSVEVPLLTGLSPTVSGTPTLVVGAGVPPGTTAISIPGSWRLRLSQPATIKAGTVLHFGYRVAENVGTNVTLAEPSFFTHPSAAVRAPGVAANTTIAVTQGSTIATLSQPATIMAGSLIGLSIKPQSSVVNYTNAATWYYHTTEPWALVQLNGFETIGTDPLHPKLLCDGCTTDGGYANDFGNSVIAAQLVPLLQQLTGQVP